MLQFAVPAVACTVLLAVSGQPVSAADTPPVFTSALDLVKVTVTVRDAKGALVTDLKREDFVITEDGTAQALELFAHAGDPEGDDAREKASPSTSAC